LNNTSRLPIETDGGARRSAPNRWHIDVLKRRVATFFQKISRVDDAKSQPPFGLHGARRALVVGSARRCEATAL